MKFEGKIKIFCDFDGTISQEDISDCIFKEFGNFDYRIKQLKNKEISIRDYWINSFSDLNTNLEEINKFIETFEIDAYFSKFIDFCNSKNIEFNIVSDGFEFYIKHFFEIHKINNMKIFCNKEETKNNRIIPKFPMANEGCNCFSAICKRNIVLNKSFDDDLLIYIGDGYSDYCGAEHSDIIFAKKNLAAYCNMKKIPHFPFKNFFDIIRILNNLIINQKFRKRHQASLKRNDAFLYE